MGIKQQVKAIFMNDFGVVMWNMNDGTYEVDVYLDAVPEVYIQCMSYDKASLIFDNVYENLITM